MPTAATSLHGCPAWQRLARHEQQWLHTPKLPIAPTLWINADADWTAQHASVPLLTMLHPMADRLEGDLICLPGALPIERDSVQTIVVQHAGDVIVDLEPLLNELCRVLQPGGQLFWFGLNPCSGWAAWSHWQARRAHTPLQARGMAFIDRLLANHGVDAVDSRYLGGLWPQLAPINEARRNTIIDGLRGAWLLSARKRRAVLTPLRTLPRQRRLRANGLSVQPSSRNPS